MWSVDNTMKQSVCGSFSVPEACSKIVATGNEGWTSWRVYNTAHYIVMTCETQNETFKQIYQN